uniref:Uncharacterized protein n=1 Tax=Nelumbo nucifera TaxID=4432 RepID=A0A822Z7R2_NELNU|nr:TPA_asm: hypothetical protein HUJ06_015435 [Nelumbo nucifera]
MSVSLEAPAMAGVDYAECGVDLKEWEHGELELPPPHLLAEEEKKMNELYDLRINCSLLNPHSKSSISLTREETCYSENNNGEGCHHHPNLGRLSRAVENRKKVTGRHLRSMQYIGSARG